MKREVNHGAVPYREVAITHLRMEIQGDMRIQIAGWFTSVWSVCSVVEKVYALLLAIACSIDENTPHINTFLQWIRRFK